MEAGALTRCALLHSVSDLKTAQIAAQYSSLCFMSSNWVINLQKQPKTFIVQNVKVQLITVQ